MSLDFSDAALALVGHGSTANADSAAAVNYQAAELRRKQLFARVVEGFWKQEPKVSSVINGLAEPRVFIVPLFVSEGYFTEEAIPRQLGFRREDGPDFERVQRRGNQTLFYARPIGSHPRMTELLLRQALEVVERHPFPRAPRPDEIALFIAGHGTVLNENSRAAVERQAAIIRERGIYAEVQSVFLEEDPRLGDCYALARSKNLVVVPFFISDGLHVNEHLPVLLGEPERVVQERLQAGRPTWRNPTEKKGRLVWCASSLGLEPQLAEVILDRVQETVAAISIGARRHN